MKMKMLNMALATTCALASMFYLGKPEWFGYVTIGLLFYILAKIAEGEERH